MNNSGKTLTGVLCKLFLTRKMPALEGVLSFLLGLPDGITYSSFGFLSGEYVAQHLGLPANGMAFAIVRLIIGLLAAMGVAVFAMNNVSREYRNLFTSKPASQLGYNYAVVRYLLRFVCMLIALLSIIPFAGMAMVAGSGLSYVFFILLVFSNMLARFCMNDYALTHVLGRWFDLTYLYLTSQYKSSRVRQKLLNQLNQFDHACYSNESLNLIAKLEQAKTNPICIFSHLTQATVLTRQCVMLVRIVSIIGFFAGAITATYLYYFAINAAMDISLLLFHTNVMVFSHCLALAAVVPTAFLWGNDTRLAFARITRKLIAMWKRQLRPAKFQTIYRSRLMLSVMGIMLFAGCGAFSETRMAYHAIQGYAGVYSILITFFAPLAFLGIYSTNVIELTEKIYNNICKWFSPKHPATVLLKLTQSTQRIRTFILHVNDQNILKLASQVSSIQKGSEAT